MTYTITTPVQGQPVPSAGFGAAVIAAVNDLDARVSALQVSLHTRVATNKITSDSATAGATAVQVESVTGILVSGQKYGITYFGRISTDVNGDSDNLRICEDTGAGTQLASVQIYLPSNSTNGYPGVVYAEYTAVASGSKTFAFTIQRSIGTGTAHRVRAGGTTPNFFYIDAVLE